MANTLSHAFADFDRYATLHDATKCTYVYLLHDDHYTVSHTIDTFSCVCGFPVVSSYHAQSMMYLAMRLMRAVRGSDLRVSIGLSSGPVSVGVVGMYGLRYCAVGDTVSRAAEISELAYVAYRER